MTIDASIIPAVRASFFTRTSVLVPVGQLTRAHRIAGELGLFITRIFAAPSGNEVLGVVNKLGKPFEDYTAEEIHRMELWDDASARQLVARLVVTKDEEITAQTRAVVLNLIQQYGAVFLDEIARVCEVQVIDHSPESLSEVLTAMTSEGEIAFNHTFAAYTLTVPKSPT